MSEAVSENQDPYNGEEAGGETGDKVLAGTRAHDGVVSPGDSRPVVSGHHQTHLKELGRILRQPRKDDLSFIY